MFAQRATRVQIVMVKLKLICPVSAEIRTAERRWMETQMFAIKWLQNKVLPLALVDWGQLHRVSFLQSHAAHAQSAVPV